MVAVETSDKHKQVRRLVCAVGNQRTGFIVRIEGFNQKDTAADHLWKDIVVMVGRELVLAGA
jgi:hypothetical protein